MMGNCLYPGMDFTEVAAVFVEVSEFRVSTGSEPGLGLTSSTTQV
jgi:hypothetical protein